MGEATLQSLNTQLLFEKLIHGTLDLDLIQVCALMGWEDNQWKTKEGQKAMRHWWLSALEKNQQGESTICLLMVVRVVLADTERYPAPKDIIQIMSNTLETLIKEDKYVCRNKQVLMFIITKKANELAQMAFQHQKLVVKLLKEANLPTKLTIVEEATILWFKTWLRSKLTVRQKMATLLNALLQPLSISQQQVFAKTLLNDSTLAKPISELRKIIENYPEIIYWLSLCDRENQFRAPFNIEEINRLNCWVGSGNYQSLRKLLLEITQQVSFDPKTLEKTDNRYIFWENYQHLFRESWLLVSENIYNTTTGIKHLKNVKIITQWRYPIILIRIGNYYILQRFIDVGTSVDLIMIDDSKRMEELLSNNNIRHTEITQLSICLIHDHLYKWQADLAYCLETVFNIKPHNSMIKITQHMSKNYHIDVVNSEFKLERKDCVQDWYHSAQSRWTATQLQAAKTAKRYI